VAWIGQDGDRSIARMISWPSSAVMSRFGLPAG
jgi:hypothetical protein